MIADVCPFLPPEIKRIQRLEKENPKLAGSELDKLHRITYENYTLERIRRKKELGKGMVKMGVIERMMVFSTTGD